MTITEQRNSIATLVVNRSIEEFKIDSPRPIPVRRGTFGDSKYKWADIPAPTDEGAYSVLIAGDRPDKLRSSIAKYKKKLEREWTGPTDELQLPEFSCFREKNEEGVVVAIRVFRTK